MIDPAAKRDHMMEERKGVNDRSAERREQILEAASAVLAQVGYEKITTRRIAQEADVNVATLHYHFGSKEALLTEVIRYALYRAEGILRGVMEAAPTPAEALAAALQATWNIAKERPGILRYDLVCRAFRDEDARRQADALYTAYRRLVEAVVERHLVEGGTLAPGVTPPDLGYYVVSAVDGILLQHLVTGNDEAAWNSLDLVRRHALSLLGREDAREEYGRDG
jgi:AcrR family transcriptional regulator